MLNIKLKNSYNNSHGFSLVMIVGLVAVLGVLAALFVVRNQQGKGTTITPQNVAQQATEQVAEQVAPQQLEAEAATSSCAGRVLVTVTNTTTKKVEYYKYSISAPYACSSIKNYVVNVNGKFMISRPSGSTMTFKDCSTMELAPKYYATGGDTGTNSAYFSIAMKTTSNVNISATVNKVGPSTTAYTCL